MWFFRPGRPRPTTVVERELVATRGPLPYLASPEETLTRGAFESSQGSDLGYLWRSLPLRSPCSFATFDVE